MCRKLGIHPAHSGCRYDVINLGTPPLWQVSSNLGLPQKVHKTTIDHKVLSHWWNLLLYGYGYILLNELIIFAYMSYTEVFSFFVTLIVCCIEYAADVAVVLH